ncbi:CubicO group peptidase, beta-lactamase class C family [Microbacterium sp. cf046]|uniref:serine hydrolase domain-containing protein n=1 Tax=Microbacterium sp. cf046 TaxID=1761803 RepID=UPI0008E94C8F|nr:CubicO group peptidase, beta-lactamase class C family [Microbacterium sp. cf046]
MLTLSQTSYSKPGYGAVVDAFCAGVSNPLRGGAALSIWRHGEEVVSISAGMADHRTLTTWQVDTPSVIFSISKGLGAIVIGQLVDQSLLDLDEPIGTIWPEFSPGGKGLIAVGDVLAHRAGVSAPAEKPSLALVADNRVWAQHIAAQEPLWPPGSGHAYHALTLGPIMNELVFRATGSSLRSLFQSHVASPLRSNITFHPTRAIIDSAAYFVPLPDWHLDADPSTDPRILASSSLKGLLPANLVNSNDGFNLREVRSLGLLAAGAIGTASGIAKVWSSTVVQTSGIRTLTPSAVSKMTAPRSEGSWALRLPSTKLQRWGAGVELVSEAAQMLSPSSFGHAGAGGQLGFADPELGVSVAYLRNELTGNDVTGQLLSSIRAVCT